MVTSSDASLRNSADSSPTTTSCKFAGHVVGSSFKTVEFVVLEDTVEVALCTENEKRGDVAQAVSSVCTDALEQTNAAEESFEIEVEAFP